MEVAWMIATGLVVILCCLKLLLQLGSKLKLPPGPPPKLGFGHLSIFGSPHKHAVLADLSKKYGPLMFFKLGSTPVVVVSSPDVAEELFKTQDQVFANRFQTTAVKSLLCNPESFTWAPYGPRWRFLRKICTSELLSPRRLLQYETGRDEEISTLVKAVWNNATKEAAEPINMRPLLRSLTTNNMTRMCMGRRFFNYDIVADASVLNMAEKEQDEAYQFKEASEHLFQLLGVQFVGDFIPYLRFLDRNSVKEEMKKAVAMMDNFVSRILQLHHGRKSHEVSSADFMDLLMSIPEGAGPEQRIGDATIKTLALAMVNGGSDTTAVASDWAFFELVRHPHAARRVQEELDSVVGKERKVKESDLPNLPYLQAVVKETLRLHPPGPLLVPHRSVEPSKLMGYDIPAKTVAFVNAWAIGRDPALWKNPHLFSPERFLDSEIDVRGKHYQLLPFGAGRRGCPGASLALTVVQLAIARLLHSFNWSLTQGLKAEDLDPSEVPGGLVCAKQVEMEVCATPRLPRHLY